jgi:hypothetical protein
MILLAQFVGCSIVLDPERIVLIASQLHSRQPGVPIRCHRRGQMRRLRQISVSAN